MGPFRTDLNQAIRSTLALVLAGGRGTRLGALTDSQAKPAIPFGGKFRVVDFPMSNCINSGLRRIGVVTQYRAHTLIRHIQRAWNFLRGELGEFVELWPAQQQTADASWYLGTADAIFQNLDIIREHAPKYVLILAGDHVYRQDYSRLIAAHIDSGAGITVSCVEVPSSHGRDFGIVEADADDHIVQFWEKPQQPPEIPNKPGLSYASMGIYVFDAEILFDELVRDARDPSSSHDFGKDILPRIVRERDVYAHPFGQSCVISEGATEPYWRDVGTLDAYWEANMDLLRVTPSLDLYDGRWPIWTYQQQRPAAKFVFDDEDRRGYAVDSMVSAGCIVSGSVVRRSLLSTDVRVNSFCDIEDSIILTATQVGRRARLHKVIVAPGCRIPEGLVIGDDPDLDAKRFERTPAGITLVTAPMLEALQ
ncbi:MAG TPA: glucose-1-phosphate adenylyltransferase [Nannocystaceae bacterium]|nr:glucose-1-phosphate adenylyltransferase [Nannocystaceae bacterium]